MNHVYRLLWSDVTLSFIVVAENAKSRGKRSGGSKAAVLLAGALITGGVSAQQVPLPGGAQVTSGQASVNTAGATMTVTQGSAKAAINWDSFSIGKGGTVNFVQPSSSSVVLNRVVGNERSVIDGTLNANGQVFLLNSNGVLFNQGASVNTAGLVASTMALSDADFNASNYRFSNNGSTASVINFGAINIADGGYAALLGRQVSNQGTINARLGTVVLAAGDKVSLNFGGDSQLNVTVDKGVLDALVENRSAILADGGKVVLTAKAVDALMATVVNNTGEIRARTVANRDGRIYLLGGFDGGTVSVAGTLDASAPDGGAGGFIDTSGTHVHVADGAVVSTLAASGATGNWLIDPNDYTISASGGNITGAQLATSLNASNVTISTATQGSGGGSGDIFVNDAVTKTGTSATTLTLLAERNINVNRAISSTTGRLNVVATADADNNATGSTTFNASGSVTTNGGNFYAGAMNGYTANARGQNFTMTDGSFINVGAGTLSINVADTVTLAGASLIATTAPNLGSYYNDGNYNSTPYFGNGITVNATGTGAGSRGTIVNAAANAMSANIIGTAGATLTAGTIGTAAAPVTLSALPGTSATSFNNYHTLTIQNNYGSSYASEIGTQAFSYLNLYLGSQANSTQNIQLMGDGGGNGTGHVLMTSDVNGLFNVATGGIDTRGIPGSTSVPIVRATSLLLSAGAIAFADNAVNTGTAASSYGASFSANGVLSSSAAGNGVADISGLTVSLNGNAGTALAPVDLIAVSLLTLTNNGSAYVNVLGDGPGTISLSSSRNPGTQSIHFAGGDHIDISADGTRQLVGTIGAGNGIDLHRGNRSLNWTQNYGYLALDTSAIDLGSGSLSMSLYGADGLNGAAVTAVNARDGNAEITAGNVTLQVMNGAASGIRNIEIAKGGTGTNNSLSIFSGGTAGGDIDVTELSANHFKTLALNLNSGAAQNVHLDLYGTDDVNLAVGANAMTIDAATVNLSALNRNVQLNTSKAVQVDGVSMGTGSYSVSSGRMLALNGDVMTNGGAITLNGSAGIQLLRPVRIDSNADDISHTTSTGNAGTIQLNGAISASAPGFALDVEAASSNAGAGTIYSFNAVGAGTNGAYLSGLRFNADGASPGTVYLYGGSYLLNGNFSSAGRTYFAGATTVDTEQGNVGHAGNINLSGASVQAGGQALTFDASTRAAGFNGGNVDLAGTDSIGVLNVTTMTVNSTGGVGGSTGSIKLPTISTNAGLTAGAQNYRGGTISLYGSLSSNGGNILLDGDVRLAGPLAVTTIDTWNSAQAQTGSAGAVTVTGGVSAATTGKTLYIDTSVATNSGFYNTTLDYTISGGAVTLAAGNAGGNYLSGLTINTLASGVHNTGADSGAITLNGVTTLGNQTYMGGTATLRGDLATNGGNINFTGSSGITLAVTPVAMTTDMAGGSSAAGTINFGSATVKGPGALSIDTTADGGGAAGAVTLGAIGTIGTIGTGAAVGSLNVKAGSITVNGPIASRGDVTLQSTGAGKLTLNAAVDSSTGNIVGASATTFVNNAGANAFTTGAGQTWQVWSSNPGTDTPGGLVASYKQYNAAYGATAVLGSGNGVFYTLAPTIAVSLAGTVAKTYDGTAAATLSSANLAVSGTVNGDTVTLTLPASSNYADANAAGAKQVTADQIAIASVNNGAQTVYGYQLANTSATAAVGTIAAKALTVSGIGATTRAYDGSRAVALTGGTLAGLVGSETLVLGPLNGAYADKNVGSAKRVTLDAVALLDGTGLASNYSVGSTDAVTGTVTARALHVSATGIGRVYDGSMVAAATLADNRVAGDSLTVGATGAAFADRNAGTGKTVNVSGIAISGADAANYAVNKTATANADITARALAVSATGINRVYDGSTAASVMLADNRVAGDSLILGNSAATFADKNAGAGKTISVSGIALSGVDAANYTANGTATTSADITARALTVGASGISRVYDGSTVAAITLADNRVAGDSLTVTGTGASFADKNAGSGKVVSV
ncbi:MAG: YDG domain-containing protein, partial [Pseudomonadota bacterium]|nr:YDG domain-containing protein [Pseudomonadota bacterium]